MSDEDEQLTVAELLARARKNDPEAEPPKRRRRRSLEDGGISVAELTGSFPKVEASPPEAKHTAVPLDEETPARKSRAERAEKAAKPEAEAKPDPTPQPEPKAAAKPAEKAAKPEAPEAEPEPEPTPQPATKATAAPKAEPATSQAPKVEAESTADAEAESPSSEETGIMGAVDTPPKAEETGVMPAVDSEEKADAVEPAGSTAASARDEQPESDNSGGANIFAILGLAVVGIVIGIAIFIGFEMMWARFNLILTAILAIAVTGVLVALTHLMRTSRDALSMTLAGIVGVVLTFGPALLAL